MSKEWYKKSFRRNLIDMHIADWDEKFLSEFNPENYAEMLKLADVDTAVIYSTSCLGNCYWPTKAGHMHNSLKGRDILNETINECRKRGINIVVYYNIWSRWAYDTHPDWRMRNVEGKGMHVDAGFRYGICCPNSPFSCYVKSQIEDLCINYEFDGLWIDMIGWFGIVCNCQYCKERYRNETGEDIPTVIDWKDIKWIRFQRKREEWFTEFTSMITNTAKSIKPDISVGHQSASWALGWAGGTTYEFFEQSDYLSGDFYGDAVEQSYVCKLMNALTENKPMEFATSRCIDLYDHTTNKTKELLQTQVYSSISNNAAFMFIDAIDPVGTINKEVYELMGGIYKQTKPYEKYMDVDAKLCCDVGIYTDIYSLFNFEECGKNVKDAAEVIQPRIKALNIAKSLIRANIPYGVITRKNLSSLTDYQVIILSDVIMMNPDEVEIFKSYVESGGSIYASRNTSLLTKNGDSKGDFQLSDLFGVSYEGETVENVTYMSPTEKGSPLFPYYSLKNPVLISGTQIKVKTKNNAEAFATLTLPYTDPRDINRFSSAISNPPGIYTTYPSVVFNRYGKGKVIYASGEIEKVEHEPQRKAFINMIMQLLSKPVYFETNAPKPVEITLFHQEDKKRYIINVLNFQSELPNIPVNGIKIKVFLGDKCLKRLIRLPEEDEINCRLNEGYVEFNLPVLNTFLMFAVDYL